MLQVTAETGALKSEPSTNGSGGGGGLVFDATAEFFKQISGGLQHDVDAKMVFAKKEEAEQQQEEAADDGRIVPKAVDEEEDTATIYRASRLRDEFEKERKRKERSSRRRDEDEGRHNHSTSSSRFTH